MPLMERAFLLQMNAGQSKPGNALQSVHSNPHSWAGGRDAKKAGVKMQAPRTAVITTVLGQVAFPLRTFSPSFVKDSKDLPESLKL